MSQSSSSASSRVLRMVAPEKLRRDPVSFRCFITRLYVKSFRVMNCTFVFRQGDDDRAALLTELSCVVADVSQSLYDDSFTLKPLFKADLHHVISVATYFTQAEKNSTSGRFESSTDSTLRDGLSRYASKRIDLTRVESGVGVRYPGHFSLPGSVVGSRHVDSWTNEVLLDQLRGVSSRDLFQLLDRVILRVNLNGAFGTTKRYVHNGAFVRH